MRAVLLAVALLVELALLAAAWWGATLDAGPAVRLLAGLGAPLLIGAVWGTCCSPKARVPLTPAAKYAAPPALSAVTAARARPAGARSGCLSWSGRCAGARSAYLRWCGRCAGRSARAPRLLRPGLPDARSQYLRRCVPVLPPGRPAAPAGRFGAFRADVVDESTGVPRPAPVPDP
ncbi:DUF2568 domain-containing protein [Micromonospora psammae]|uniref:DUF2568 domain-containing protein n=1 Tax=Micromonospora sp. CPCC 205556 TaxID=3122398 RepID=UPI002FF1F971